MNILTAEYFKNTVEVGQGWLFFFWSIVFNIKRGPSSLTSFCDKGGGIWTDPSRRCHITPSFPRDGSHMWGIGFPGPCCPLIFSGAWHSVIWADDLHSSARLKQQVSDDDIHSAFCLCGLMFPVGRATCLVPWHYQALSCFSTYCTTLEQLRRTEYIPCHFIIHNSRKQLCVSTFLLTFFYLPPLYPSRGEEPLLIWVLKFLNHILGGQGQYVLKIQ